MSALIRLSTEKIEGQEQGEAYRARQTRLHMQKADQRLNRRLPDSPPAYIACGVQVSSSGRVDISCYTPVDRSDLRSACAKCPVLTLHHTFAEP